MPNDSHQNRRQDVVNSGALRLCRGVAWHLNLTKIPLIYCFKFQFGGGLQLCLGGLSLPPKPPRVDRTGSHMDAHRTCDLTVVRLFKCIFCLGPALLVRHCANPLLKNIQSDMNYIFKNTGSLRISPSNARAVAAHM